MSSDMNPRAWPQVIVGAREVFLPIIGTGVLTFDQSFGGIFEFLFHGREWLSQVFLSFAREINSPVLVRLNWSLFEFL
jgi:hypothetical protein